MRVSLRARLKLEHLEERTVLDVGNGMGDALWTDLYYPGAVFVQSSEALGDGALGNQDVDMYLVYGGAGQVLYARTSSADCEDDPDTIVRIFRFTTGGEVDYVDDAGDLCSGIGIILPAEDFYYVGISGYPNFNYSPVDGSGGVSGSTGTYRLDLLMYDVAPPVSADVADAASEGLDTGIVYGGIASFVQAIADGPFGNRDVDLYYVYGAAGSTLYVTTSLPANGIEVDTMIRIFDTNFNQIAIDDDRGGNLYSYLRITLPAEGYYLIGVSGYPNEAYDPFIGGSGVPGDFGDYRLDINLIYTGAAPGGHGDPGQGAATLLLQPASQPVVPLTLQTPGFTGQSDQTADPIFVGQPQTPTVQQFLGQSATGRLADRLLLKRSALDLVFENF